MSGRQGTLDAVGRLVQAGRLAEAADLCRELLEDDGPGRTAVLDRLADIAMRRNDPADAAQWLRASLRLDPRQPVAWMRLGIALHRMRQSETALACLDQATTRAPGLPQAHVERGILLRDLGRFEAALASYDRAVSVRADFAPARFARGLLRAQLRSFDRALEDFEGAVALRPDYAEAHAAKAELLLLLGRYREGWPLYEWRWRCGLGRPYRLAGGDIPLWTGGEDVAGRTVLVLPEFGLGDFLMLFRYVPGLLERGAAVVVSAPAPLVALFSSVAGIRVVPSGAPLPPIDFQCPIMSLPRAFATTPETIPAKFPYLAVDPGKRALWQRRLGAPGRPRIGLMWSGREDRNIDRNPLRNRRVPLAMLAGLGRLPFEYHALQKELPDGDADLLSRLDFVRDHRSELADFSDTAALVDLMDLVISVDTSVAHLAGALGRPLWVMLPFATDFRWLPDGTTTPWYPRARLFRQPEPGDWPVVEAVGRRLATWGAPPDPGAGIGSGFDPNQGHGAGGSVC